MNIMVYGGLKQIALKIASDADLALPLVNSGRICFPDDEEHCSRRLLLQDTTSTSQIALYKTFNVYQQNVSRILEDIQKIVDCDRTQIQEILDNESTVEKAEEEAAREATQRNSLQKLERNPNFRENAAPPVPAPAPPSGAGSGGGGATTPPIALTYLGDISSAISAAKSGISYSSSSIQPTTQALTTELGRDLRAKGIALYTSTSPVNLPLSNEVMNALVAIEKLNAEIQSKVYANAPEKIVQDGDSKTKLLVAADKPKIQALVSDIASRAAAANQMMTTFQSWLSGGDGNANLILTDVIRGWTLSCLIGDGIPALQFTIDAAGGNTRTNSYFLLNLFYTPKPSFNAGVVVTYELRDKKDMFIGGDTLKVLYDYSKWQPKCFLMRASDEVNDTSLSTGRSDNNASRVSKRFLCENQ